MTIKPNQIHGAIAEHAFGWEAIEGLYPVPGNSGTLEPCPDYLGDLKAQQMLLEEMGSKGLVYTREHIPANFEKNTGQQFIAKFRRGAGTFESTQLSDGLAICVAALKAFGVEIVK